MQWTTIPTYTFRFQRTAYLNGELGTDLCSQGTGTGTKVSCEL